MRFYQLDLTGAIETAGCRRLWVLVNGLPPEAATWRIDGQQWTTLHELVSVVAERIDLWGLTSARIATRGKIGSTQHPLRVPRPGESNQSYGPVGSDSKKDRVVSNPREIAAWFS